MHVVLWDTRRNDAQKDFAGGMGVGMYPGRGGVRGQLIRHFYQRDYRPVAMNFAYLAAILQHLGHTVEYALDRLPQADLYVFNPSLLTVEHENQAIDRLLRLHPSATVLIVGQAAHALPELFMRDGVTVVRGEPEQLLWRLDEVVSSNQSSVDVGSVANLDELPTPDWSVFDYKKFRIHYDFTRFPTALIQQSRGCTFTCNYCPYIMVENKTRFRDPESVVAEIRRGYQQFGFRSFKFRDPLFGLDRKRVLRLAELMGQLPFRIQFSIESRIDLMRLETLQVLKKVGLTSITVGIETPDEATLRKYKRAPVNDDRQRDFVARCREMGIRTVAGFMVGFPGDTRESIFNVLNYARQVNPTYANFNMVTPYPGTQFFSEVREQIANYDYSQYSVYEPVLQYEHLTPDEVKELHAACVTKFYFRSRYLVDNAHLLWRFVPASMLRRFRTSAQTSAAQTERRQAA